MNITFNIYFEHFLRNNNIQVLHLFKLKSFAVINFKPSAFPKILRELK